MKQLGTAGVVLVELSRGLIVCWAVDISEGVGLRVNWPLVLEGFDRVGRRQSVSPSASSDSKLGIYNVEQ